MVPTGKKTRRTRAAAVTASIVAALTLATTGAFVAPAANAQNVIQRHPTATGAAAGVATHHALKVSARNKKRRGRRLNFAERHPTLTGIGVALGTRHAIKSTTHRRNTTSRRYRH